MTSFGSGAGSDSFTFRVTEEIGKIQDKAPSVAELLAAPIYLDYAITLNIKTRSYSNEDQTPHDGDSQ